MNRNEQCKLPKPIKDNGLWEILRLTPNRLRLSIFFKVFSFLHIFYNGNVMPTANAPANCSTEG